MRRAVDIVILFSLMVSALSLSASAQSQNTFYLHASYLLDQNAPTGTTANALKLATGEYYVWKTALFSAQLSFPAGAWTAAVWMNTTQGPTQYRLKLGTANRSGGFVEYAHSFTPIVTSASPARYEVSISVGVLNVPAGESLAVGFLRQWQNGSYSPAAFIFFDSQAIPSSLNSPTTTTSQQTTTTTSLTTVSTTTSATTTQTTTITHLTTSIAEVGAGSGFGFAVIAIGAGLSAAGAGVAFAASGRPYSEVFAYGGYYYCRKHRVPVWYLQGWLWCPVERRYLRP